MQLKDIYIYPIKSLAGIRLEKCELEERGFKYDRRWMLVDKSGKFLTQRKFTQMALLQVKISAKGLQVSPKRFADNFIKIPFTPNTDRLIPVTIWEDEVIGQLVDPYVSSWFSEQLEFDCDLVMMPDTTYRKLKRKYAVKGESVSFADSMPYLLIGQGSLDDLNERLPEPVAMDRFRPNLVFSGGEAFIEDTWDRIRIGNALFKITKPCARCVMTTVDQETAVKGKEPLKTLAKYRNMEGKVLFGQNMLLLEGHVVYTGDRVKVI